MVLDLVRVTGEVEKVKKVVVIEEDVSQTSNEVLLTSKTCQSHHVKPTHIAGSITKTSLQVVLFIPDHDLLNSLYYF